MMLRKITLLCALSVTATASLAQGNLDFSRIPGLDQPPKVRVDLNAGMLGFIKQAAMAADPNAASVMDGIESITVRVYELDRDDDQEAVAEFIDDASESLERDGWQPTVYVNDDSSKVRIYARFEGSNLDGLTIMVADGGDTVFVNVAGMIDPTTLGMLANQFGFSDMMGGFSPAQAVPPAAVAQPAQ